MIYSLPLKNNENAYEFYENNQEYFPWKFETVRISYIKIKILHRL